MVHPRSLALLLVSFLGATAAPTSAQGGGLEEIDGGDGPKQDGIGSRRVPPPPPPPDSGGGGGLGGPPGGSDQGGGGPGRPGRHAGAVPRHPNAPVTLSTPVAAPTAAGPATWSAPREPLEWWDWWEHNRELYLDVDPFASMQPRTHTGDDELAELIALESARRREAVQSILLELVREGEDSALLREALLALGRVGDEQPGGRVASAISAHLSDARAPVAEAAVVALGALGGREALLALGELCLDTTAARARLGEQRVPTRMRALAAYAAGLAAREIEPTVPDDGALRAGPARAELTRYAAHVLAQVLEVRDEPEELQAAAVVAFGMTAVPVKLDDSRRPAAAGATRPGASPSAQIRFLLALLADEDRPRLARIHAPTAVARIARAAEGALEPGLRVELVEALLAALHSKEEVGLRRSALIALGEVATSGGDELDARARAALFSARRGGDLFSRRFATLALARAAGRPGPAGALLAPFGALAEVERELLGDLLRGRSSERTWSALALGVLGAGLREHDERVGLHVADALRRALVQERNASELAAYALALGLIGDGRAVEDCAAALALVSEEGFHGLVAVGLGLLRQRSALAPLTALSTASDHRPALLEASGLARALIGDPELSGEMVARIAACDCVTSLAGAAGALARSEDPRALQPLAAFARDKAHPLPSRAVAVRALAWIAQRDRVPWEALLGAGLNYADLPATLADGCAYGRFDLP